MKLGQQGYKELKQRNRTRLIVAIIVVLIILLISYVLLLPTRKTPSVPEREAAVNMPVAGGEGDNDRLNTGPIKTNAWLFKEAVDKGKKAEFRLLSGENEEENLAQDEEVGQEEEENNDEVQEEVIHRENLEGNIAADSPIPAVVSAKSAQKALAGQDTAPQDKKIEKVKDKEPRIKPIDITQKAAAQKVKAKEGGKFPGAKNKNSDKDKKEGSKGGKVEGSEFTIQVVALSDPIEAAGIKARLAGKGFPARVEQIKNASGQPFYRVRVGSYPSEDKAAQVVEQLKKAGFSARTFKR